MVSLQCRGAAPSGLALLAVDRGRPHTRGMGERMDLTLNGKTRALGRPMTVADLLAEIGLDARKVAVERNEEIVPRSAYATTWLAHGDALEIVHFIGGG